MNYTHLRDDELLLKIKDLRSKERNLLTEILHHLREVERRRLFSELGCPSLFAYAVAELGYSDGQAGRRIAAMRLLKDLPEIESKIKSGSLNLTHLSQAQRFINESNRENTAMNKEEKLSLLSKLENKSSRFVMDEELKNQLEEVRSLIGPEATHMSFAELLSAMAKLSAQSLKEKRFGKKRAREKVANTSAVKESTTAPKSEPKPRSRYISQSLRHLVWQNARGKCEKCGSKRNLQVDHIKPVALGGLSQPENLRLLCFHCNQRAAAKSYGYEFMEKWAL